MQNIVFYVDNISRDLGCILNWMETNFEVIEKWSVEETSVEEVPIPALLLFIGNYMQNYK